MLRSGKVEVYCHADPTFRIKRVLQAEVIQKQVCRDTRVRGRGRCTASHLDRKKKDLFCQSTCYIESK
ncbi:hypothetical protein S83_037988 [Arachis hypogaea]